MEEIGPIGGREIEELAVRVLQGRATRAERALVETWRRASPENAHRFRLLVRIWDHTSEAADAASTPPPEASRLLVRAARRHAARRKRMASREQQAATHRLIPWAAAAALTFLLVGYFSRSSPPAPSDGTPVAREITTGGNEMVTVGLDDGTVVRVAPRSRLGFRRGADRQVWLDGRAFFSVATDPTRPFRVRTAGGDVVALGTRFEVAARERDVRVLVVEGRVELSTGGSRVELGARKLAEALAGGHATVHEVDDVLPHLAWLGRTLVFRDTPLRDAGREIHDRFGVPMRFENAEIADRRITAAFTDEDLDEVLRVLCRAAGVRCTRTGSSIVVAPRAPPPQPRPDLVDSSKASPAEREA